MFSDNNNQQPQQYPYYAGQQSAPVPYDSNAYMSQPPPRMSQPPAAQPVPAANAQPMYPTLYPAQPAQPAAQYQPGAESPIAAASPSAEVPAGQYYAMPAAAASSNTKNQQYAQLASPQASKEKTTQQTAMILLIVAIICALIGIPVFPLFLVSLVIDVAAIIMYAKSPVAAAKRTVKWHVILILVQIIPRLVIFLLGGAVAVLAAIVNALVIGGSIIASRQVPSIFLVS